MYNTITKQDFLKKLNLGDDYSISGFLVFGGFKKYYYELLKQSALKIDPNATFRQLPDEFINPILEFKLNGKNYWFAIAYGGALLCEWLHVACSLGSKQNIILGSLGGLVEQGSTRDLVIPEYSFANESTTRAYDPQANNKHYANPELRKRLFDLLEDKHRIWQGPTITHEAMLAETWEDIQRWSKEGYYGVEMEAATVFAVSKFFKVPSAAILRISDNLIQKKTVFDVAHENGAELKKKLHEDMFDAALQVLFNK
ncbi:MAG: Purine or other phosphorylase family 1 [Candidatus Uhrbacteria bacterium GW2011_GWD1_41_16]|uniref:Uridine phosphorylase n=1 Tax=Candidatus Uhrbacteria bacterium GW2011_GWC1_41_20 TaxID=1618983 RepID=A0A0G0XL04_9BACT|nr:MAG: Purine or other phosphorylase family 1 [Candidatus Uhrbacteria bacterium GW2011_GWE1_39_46]KKR63072.1 MAG: Purine or other phosphorylase family 1 [Candidatus Uhrbacteria bacterium GW2011_GWC2_40_450]KKR88374.1 MAG: Purine or other phosphorylase family 1 [Candidatus Uhrbacteria bacterium GW2011_GWE2_41_1153]KKR94116.1 MAG: Purine or other phosphorylase family 1 [Candidatus Uhrbacteria bacterium GW2011_GWD1_41_16]KKR97465.1 MAG: Purine or other phosphorylase family 1 [Candidatus Uhrbacter